MVRVCQNCGSENREDALECGTCEAPLNDRSAHIQASAVTGANSQAVSTCSHCGHDNLDSDVICAFCQTMLNDLNGPQIQGTLVCQNCSQINNPGALTCRFCGVSLFDKHQTLPTKTIDYPVFYRSPRLNVTTPAPSIEFQSPPNLGEKPQISLLSVILPPLAMIGITVGGILLFGQSTSSVFYMVPMTLITLIVSVFSYLSQVKKWKQKTTQQTDFYNDYLKNLQGEAEDVYKYQRLLANIANPDTATCLQIVERRSRRLWERLQNDIDFTSVKLGIGNLPLITDIIIPKQQIGEPPNQLIIEAQKIKESFTTVKDVAVVLPIKEICTVGFIGKRDGIIKCVSNCIVQLATHHSYLDVKIVLLTNEKEAKQWSWVRWLPHVWDPSRTHRYVAVNAFQSSELLDHFESILQKRMDLLNTSNNKLFTPFYLFVITDAAITRNRKLLDFLSVNHTNLCAAAFYLFDSAGKLPKQCNYFVEMDKQCGSLIPRSDAFRKRQFTVDSFYDYDLFARKLAPVRDSDEVQGSSLPKSVTIFEGWGINKSTEIDVLENWKKATPQSSLKAKIGVMENGKPFYFDIHEKTHGPHGLVAGTTGAGKSELLKTWILSMCISYAPHDVSFVLIDFKGMSLAGPLSSLPHIAGIISNIGTNIERNMISLESELKRRQQLFALASTPDMQIGDIYDYQDAYRRGKTNIPLSHLVIVVDEFAELKSKFPDFMDAIEHSARVGRSLGVHLVLATQTVEGNVTNEIRTNSSFRWCLRVASEEDSRAVLGRNDAGAPHVPTGRFFCQVRNKEVFEQVQSYWSGAQADLNINNEAKIPPVSFINYAGVKETVIKTKKKMSQESTQLYEIVKHIAQTHQLAGLPSARKIWQEELPSHIPYPKQSSEKPVDSLFVPLGIYDDLTGQCQLPYIVDLSKGNVLIIGNAFAGKTNLLQNIIRHVSENYSPEEVSVYIMDFASTMLRSFGSVNHVGGIVIDGEKERIKQLFKFVQDEIDNRNRLFSELGANSPAAYSSMSGCTMPHLLVLIDNLRNLLEAYNEYEEALLSILEKGINVGVSIVATARQSHGLRIRFLSLLPTRIAFNCTEPDEYNNIFERCSLHPVNLPGRGLIKLEQIVYEFQSFLAFDGETDMERTQRIKALIGQVKAAYPGKNAISIPEIPEVLTSDYPETHRISLDKDSIFLGLDFEEIEPVTIKLHEVTSIGILGRKGSGKSNLTRTIMHYFIKNIFDLKTEVYILDGYDRQLEEFIKYGFVKQYGIDCEGFEGFVGIFTDKAKERLEILKSGGNLQNEPLLLMVVQNHQVFSKGVIDDQVAENFRQLLMDARQMKICAMFTDLENLSGYGLPDMVNCTKGLDQYYFLDEVDKIQLISLSLSYKDVLRYKTPLRPGEGFSFSQRAGLAKVKFVKTERIPDHG